MNYRLFIQIACCIVILMTFLHSYISKQNMLTALRLEIPALAKQLEEIAQENTRLQFEIDQFENPSHLIELSRKPEWRHLKHPFASDIIELKIP